MYQVMKGVCHMAEDVKSAENCLRAVDALKQELQNGRRSLINSETCVVNRTNMSAQLSYLEENLPGTIRKAAEIVQEEEKIRTETYSSRDEILNTANAQAQATMADAMQRAHDVQTQANNEANALLEHAEKEAAACIENAKAEAKRILSEAEAKAKQLVEEESIVRRARVECEELRENARQEAASLHKNTLDYMDSLLADTDRKLSELINSIRLERNEIRNHR